MSKQQRTPIRNAPGTSSTTADGSAGVAPRRNADSDAGALRDAVRSATRRRSLPLKIKGKPSLLQESFSIAKQTSVFVSYAHEDKALVATLISAIEPEGFKVHFDRDFPGGTKFEDRIRHLIATTDATLVLWSPASVRSPYVKAEARLALRADKLVCVHTEGLDMHDLPFEFCDLSSLEITETARIVGSLVERAASRRSVRSG